MLHMSVARRRRTKRISGMDIVAGRERNSTGSKWLGRFYLELGRGPIRPAYGHGPRISWSIHSQRSTKRETLFCRVSECLRLRLLKGWSIIPRKWPYRPLKGKNMMPTLAGVYWVRISATNSHII